MRSINSKLLIWVIICSLILQYIALSAHQQGQQNSTHIVEVSELIAYQDVAMRVLAERMQDLTYQVGRLGHDPIFIASMALDTGRLSMFKQNKNKAILSKEALRLGAETAFFIHDKAPFSFDSFNASNTVLENTAQEWVMRLGRQSKAQTMIVYEHVPLQLSAVLLKIKGEHVWLVMAFDLKKVILSALRDVVPLPLTLFIRDRGHWEVIDTILNKEEAARLAKGLLNVTSSGFKKLTLENKTYSLQIIKLTQQYSPEIMLVVQKTAHVKHNYTPIQIAWLVSMCLCLLIVVVGYIRFNKRIKKPLYQLSEVAKRLGAGDYRSPIHIQGEADIQDLARAFTSMRDKIAQRESEIKRLAYWDTLTQLPNRAQFIQLLAQAIDEAVKSRQSCCVLIMDLDRFKYVNDVMGHSFGDQLLKQVAYRLREAMPEKQLARLGGDEFAILLPNSQLAHVREVAGNVLSLLEHPIFLEDQAVDLSVSVGVACFPDHAEDAESVLTHAEVAMYMAKRSVGNHFVVYSPEIDRGSQQNLSLLSELRFAIYEDQLRLYVQPKLDLRTKEIVGVEALVRWMHPTRGFLEPDQFIPFAEQTGVIRLLTHWILDKAAAFCSELTGYGITLNVSVNLSTYDLLDQELPIKLADILTKYRLQTSSLCLEITETAIMNDPHRAALTLDRLHAMGLGLSIDDFGTGYSSLAYLKELPVSELKIDKSFVLYMAHSEEDKKIVKSTIDLGHNMGLTVVAEGVTHANVMTLLTEMGCDLVQGNYINPAISADTFIDWLKQNGRFYSVATCKTAGH